MGRPPSLATAQRRPTRAARTCTDDLSSLPDDAAAAAVLTSPASQSQSSGSSEQTPQFPRRAPRTGTAYQVKVPAYQVDNDGGTENSFDRPAPILMSRDVPHETAVAMEQSSLFATTVTTTTGMYYLFFLFIRNHCSRARQDPRCFGRETCIYMWV
jgi:hypothetical protein